jgi:HK97 family phage major capsid protein
LVSASGGSPTVISRSGPAPDQPQGIVTGASLGVVGSSSTSYTFEDLLDLEHSVDPAYRANAQFVLSDAALRQIKGLKDNDGRPLWMAGLTVALRGPSLVTSYIINQDMPAPGAGNKSLLFGDTSKHIVRDVREVTLKRLDERYAEMDAVAFVAFSRHDARMVDAGYRPRSKYLANKAA